VLGDVDELGLMLLDELGVLDDDSVLGLELLLGDCVLDDDVDGLDELDDTFWHSSPSALTVMSDPSHRQFAGRPYWLSNGSV